MSEARSAMDAMATSGHYITIGEKLSRMGEVLSSCERNTATQSAFWTCSFGKKADYVDER